ncbi:hypothetical protein KY289_027138 [Solanum tuberosum]|nr:hypothetical protein KY289_027138 [Solanum tuberosum]KAH0662026.1 hypothetical protein KY284_026957 [Solanum tuberosum]
MMSHIDLSQPITFDEPSGQETNCIRHCDTSEKCTVIENLEVVSTSTSPLLVTSPSPDEFSSCDSSAINPSTASNNIDYTVLALGKRSRQVSHKLPGYDYVLPPSLAQLNDQLSPTQSANSMVHPLSHSISYSKLSSSHSAFLTDISSINKPKSFTQAVKHTHWKEAIAKEILALKANHTWTLQIYL